MKYLGVKVSLSTGLLVGNFGSQTIFRLTINTILCFLMKRIFSDHC